jgi:hypothetical protein
MTGKSTSSKGPKVCLKVGVQIKYYPGVHLLQDFLCLL